MEDKWRKNWSSRLETSIFLIFRIMMKKKKKEKN